MTVHIIYDNRRPEKWEPLMKELSTQGITDYRIWEPVYDPDSIIRSINLSHKQIIRWAKENNLPEVAILEDDIQFTAKGAWDHFLAGKPIWRFDLWIGGTYGLNKPITGKIEAINGFHCYICSDRFYDTFLSVPDDIHVDVAMDNLGLYYVQYPFIAIQHPGWSSNSRAFSDKNVTLTQEDLYQG